MVKDLIYVAPEEEGLSSTNVLKFIDKIEEYKINLHSFMLVKRGKILSEGYYKPFDENFKHRLFSASKTFVSLAIGKLIGEKKLSLSDKLCELMPELVDGELDKWMKDCTVEDALKMSVPMLTTTYYARDYKDWAWTFFSHPERSKALKPAGTLFSYNTSATFILCVLIEKLTGKTFLEVLAPVLKVIGVSENIDCVKSPDGYCWGGSGVICTLRDFAKVGELILNKGEYNGVQLIDREYMEKATSKQISNVVNNEFTPDLNGYGYQIWITKHGYAMKGMGAQLALCYPSKDFLFVCNADTQGCSSAMQTIAERVDEMLFEKIQDIPLEKGEDYIRLKKRLENLEIVKDFGVSHSKTKEKINGIKYRLRDGAMMGWKWFKFDFDGNKGLLTYENERGIKKITFGLGDYVLGTFPETHYSDWQVDAPANRELDAYFIANWKEEKQLLLRAYIIDKNIGNCFMNFSFKGDEVGLQFIKNAEFFLDDYSGFAGGEKE